MSDLVTELRERRKMSDAVLEAMARAMSRAEHDACSVSGQDLSGHDPEGAWDCYTQHVRAALRAAEAAGWVLVPVEATEEMRLAGTAMTTKIYKAPNEIWSAMLRAAPSLGGSDAGD